MIDVVRKDIKNMHLAVYPPTGRVRISVPLRIDDDAVKLFAISKLTWIKRHQKSFKNQERQSAREYIERESHYFLGNRYLLRITEENKPPKVSLKSKTYLDLHIRPNTSLLQRQDIINQWYRKELKAISLPLIEKWEKIIGVKTNDWGVKQMKTKWGTCSIEAKRIWLNLELAKKPIHCTEYIIVHELVHLLERNHNEQFIAYMDRFMPQWRYYKEQLIQLPASHENWSY